MEHRPDSALVTPEVARAEELVDELTQNASVWARHAGLEILKRVALAREEAEDIWAEARALSRDEG
jgi:hypothetical protein